ncbi:IS701 family transposase [Streptomyces siamensis]|uniref:IS701 family transposase n=1 Tax=Streptomyces siamensis TaxID=1274986 RepID=A0ABP9JH46_9ACTN
MWDPLPLRRRIAQRLCEVVQPEVWVVDDVSFPKCGTTSLGVARQYCGALGKRANCQVAVSVHAATDAASCPLEWELFPPEEWAHDDRRHQRAGIPEQAGHVSKAHLALGLLDRLAAQGLTVPVVVADAGYGRSVSLRLARRFLEDAGLSYVVAVPKSQQVHGPRIDHLIDQAPPEAWQRLSCGDGATGPRLYDWAAARLPAVWEFDGDEPTRQRRMLARRSTTRPDEIAYYLASAPLDITVADLARIAGCRWKIEECFQSAKNECGLDQYEVRRYVGWYRHITLVTLAHVFLAAMTVQEREKGVTRPTHPSSWISPRQKSAVCWQLNPTVALHGARTQ